MKFKHCASAVAALVLGGSMLVTTPASAASTVIEHNDVLYQVNSSFHAYVTVDLLKVDGGKFQARVNISDESGGAGYVAANQVRVERWNGSRWVAVAETAGMDGWWPNADYHNSPVHSCSGRETLRARAYFQGKYGSGGSVAFGEWVETPKRHVCPLDW